MDSLDSHTLTDLQIEFERRLMDITIKYCIFVSYIRNSLKAQNVSAKSLCADLVNFSAFDHSVQEVQELNLLSTHETELEQASDLDDIFILLGTEFSNFDIYDNEWLVHRHPVTDDDGCIFRLHF